MRDWLFLYLIVHHLLSGAWLFLYMAATGTTAPGRADSRNNCPIATRLSPPKTNTRNDPGKRPMYNAM